LWKNAAFAPPQSAARVSTLLLCYGKQKEQQSSNISKKKYTKLQKSPSNQVISV